MSEQAPSYAAPQPQEDPWRKMGEVWQEAINASAQRLEESYIAAAIDGRAQEHELHGDDVQTAYTQLESAWSPIHAANKRIAELEGSHDAHSMLLRPADRDRQLQELRAERDKHQEPADAASEAFRDMLLAKAHAQVSEDVSNRSAEFWDPSAAIAPVAPAAPRPKPAPAPEADTPKPAPAAVEADASAASEEPATPDAPEADADDSNTNAPEHDDTPDVELTDDQKETARLRERLGRMEQKVTDYCADWPLQEDKDQRDLEAILNARQEVYNDLAIAERTLDLKGRYDSGLINIRTGRIPRDKRDEALQQLTDVGEHLGEKLGFTPVNVYELQLAEYTPSKKPEVAALQDQWVHGLYERHMSGVDLTPAQQQHAREVWRALNLASQDPDAGIDMSVLPLDLAMFGELPPPPVGKDDLPPPPAAAPDGTTEMPAAAEGNDGNDEPGDLPPPPQAGDELAPRRERRQRTEAERAKRRRIVKVGTLVVGLIATVSSGLQALSVHKGWDNDPNPFNYNNGVSNLVVNPGVSKDFFEDINLTGLAVKPRPQAELDYEAGYVRWDNDPTNQPPEINGNLRGSQPYEQLHRQQYAEALSRFSKK